ncbi:hypothetical protein EYZ11_002693 [Aspergillus tanneri]|uniref:Pinin/SDK/MemA protein domain-containing protein n=1 Tax=Aspergillus tanneri TaxID=1220188 RepID=A0A4S3JQV7_9EURO|nr:hypothetical protein EYZ11_002693 [Aspergillus tanneri]
MAEESLASAVALPDQENTAPSPDAAGLKRRQSSISDPDPDNKRRRLSFRDDNDERRSVANGKQTSPDGADQKPDRRPSRQTGRRDEERKRGQRLFGALLGTLSQSSNSAAQKRRADIEKRQQDKLKLQDEEYDELKRKRRDERAAIRKKEQIIYDEEAMRTRHSNLLAMAQFLKTKSEPVLYYKPWQLRSDDHSIIQKQIEDAEATITREVAEFKTRYLPEEENHKDKDEAPPGENFELGPVPEIGVKEEIQEPMHVVSDTPGAATNHEKSLETTKTEDTSTEDHNVPDDNGQSDVHRGHDDDGGEVVEDQEDTVIY